MVLSVALSAYASDDKKPAEVIATEYNSTILEVEENNLKVSDRVLIEHAGDVEGIVTAVDENIVIISIKNNGFAEGSKLILKISGRAGNAGAKKAVVKATKLNSVILDVKGNNFKEQDRITLSADGTKQATVKAVDNNIVILSLNDSGFAEGSKVLLEKAGKGGFKEKFKEKKRS